MRDLEDKDDQFSKSKSDSRRQDVDFGAPLNEASVSKLRRILPQILSVTAKNLVLFDLGMTMAFPAIVIPVLLSKESVDPQGLSFDESQASWFASIGMICQPFGSALSGMISAPLGRKRSLMLVNIPQIVGWLLLSSASSVEVMYAATALQGLGAGFMDAPIFTYVGEICEPSLRGVLISYSLQFCSVGFFLQCLLGSLTHWRNVALISIIFPSLAFICISQIPETPMWLLSKNRVEEAENALCWLRGWVPKEAVAKEFSKLIDYSNNSKYQPLVEAKSILGDNPPLKRESVPSPGGDSTKQSTVSSPSGQRTNPHEENMSFREKFRDLLRPEITRPMMVILIINVLYFCSGFPGFKSYMVLVFQRLRIPLDANWASVVLSSVLSFSNILQMILVKTIGKRKMTLLSTVGSTFCCFAIAIQTNFHYFLSGWMSEYTAGWLLFIYFIILSFMIGLGLGPVPWMLMSEIFPFRGRSFASGVCAAIFYTMSFFSSMTYLSLQNYLGITESHYLFGVISALGFVYVYLHLPETEGKSLEEIEEIYKSNSWRKSVP